MAEEPNLDALVATYIKIRSKLAEMEAEQRRERLALARQGGPKPAIQAPSKRDVDKVGRNDDCPCGSGKKYKKCCGQ